MISQKLFEVSNDIQQVEYENNLFSKRVYFGDHARVKDRGVRSHNVITAFFIKILSNFFNCGIIEILTDHRIIYLNKNSFEKWHQKELKIKEVTTDLFSEYKVNLKIVLSPRRFQKKIIQIDREMEIEGYNIDRNNRMDNFFINNKIYNENINNIQNNHSLAKNDHSIHLTIKKIDNQIQNKQISILTGLDYLLPEEIIQLILSAKKTALT